MSQKSGAVALDISTDQSKLVSKVESGQQIPRLETATGQTRGAAQERFPRRPHVDLDVIPIYMFQNVHIDQKPKAASKNRRRILIL